MTPKLALETAVKLAGGQSALAKAIGVKQGHIWTMLNREGYAAIDYVVAIEEAVGGKITRFDLRPDIFGAKPKPKKSPQLASAAQ
jgi:DNA-binding transcriptional regulator YdaS (Cro superfamily)